MPSLTIAFPVFDPIAISIGPIAIRWYALAYIGGIVLGWIYARALIKSEKFWGGPAPVTLPQMDDSILSLGDITTAVGPIGLCLGRLANFINSELWGRPADASVPWAMVFPTGGPLPRHPSQLYEASCEGILLFLLLFIAERYGARWRPGVLT